MLDIDLPDVATLKARHDLRLMSTPVIQTPREFIVGRWPHTYAYDQVRSRKVGVVDSRAEAAGYVKNQAMKAGLPVEFVKEMLATAYCIENNIELPAALRSKLR